MTNNKKQQCASFLVLISSSHVKQQYCKTWITCKPCKHCTITIYNTFFHSILVTPWKAHLLNESEAPAICDFKQDFLLKHHRCATRRVYGGLKHYMETELDIEIERKLERE